CVIPMDSGIVRCDLVVNPPEKLASRRHVRLVHARHAVRSIRRSSLSPRRELEGVSNHPLRPPPRDNPRVDREFVDPTAGEKPSGGRLQSFRVLPDDHEVDLARLPNLLELVVDLTE